MSSIRSFFFGIPPRTELAVDLIITEPKVPKELRRLLLQLGRAFGERADQVETLFPKSSPDYVFTDVSHAGD